MSLLSLVAGFLAAGAAAASGPGRVRSRGRDAPSGRSEIVDAGAFHRLRPLLALLAVAAGFVVLGGFVGACAGIGAGITAWRVLGAAEGPAAKRRRQELEDDLPLAVHLLGATLRSGAAIGPALRTVGAALPGAVAEEFGGIAARLDLGADPASVWAAVADGGSLAPLGSALARAHRSGASVITVIDRLSTDLRAGLRSRTEARARTVEVRAAAPLGLCLLPSFLLLGVVPMTVGLFSSLDFLR